MSEVIFEPGDIVTCAFFGDREFVLESYDCDMYPVCIFFADEDGKSVVTYFTKGGLFFDFHITPVLKLVRKKSKEHELVESFMVKHMGDNFYLNVTDSYESALAWIKLRGNPIYEYQIEKFYKVKE